MKPAGQSNCSVRVTWECASYPTTAGYRCPFIAVGGRFAGEVLRKRSCRSAEELPSDGQYAGSARGDAGRGICWRGAPGPGVRVAVDGGERYQRELYARDGGKPGNDRFAATSPAPELPSAFGAADRYGQ